jgi:hypothetical protein
MRAFAGLAVMLPAVLYAGEAEVASPSCAHPAALAEHHSAHSSMSGDWIFFKPGTDWLTVHTALIHKYGLTLKADLLSGMSVAHLTAEEIAELRCDPDVERISRDVGP